MPLVRYEIRNEHSLANPQLYRTASKDDPEGLLEGVAMAGLVGIVRQLGDLAEFAAEVFRDLHEEVMATASRGHELLARVQQLEAEMPAVERALLAETNQLRFAYTPGVDWHASIRNDQNHCTQGDLPRFIRNSYEDCRGPPRLFLLDKFDVAGAGACLKRYTDPSFFRTEWASSELMKAERIQRDKKAKREKKKGRRRRNGDIKEGTHVDQLNRRVGLEFSSEHKQLEQLHPRSTEASSGAEKGYSPKPNIIYGNSDEAPGLGQDTTGTNDDSSGCDNNSATDCLTGVPPLSEILASSESVIRTSASAIKDEQEHMPQEWEDTENIPALHGETSFNSHQVIGGMKEAEQFVDALTTIELEVDSDSEPRSRQDVGADADGMSDTKESQSASQGDFTAMHGPSAEENVSLSLQRSQKSMSIDSSGDAACNSSTVTSGQDLCRTPPLTTIVLEGIHKTKPVSPVKISNNNSVDKPHEDFVSLPEAYFPLKNEKGAAKIFELGAVSSFNAGVKVSKMVAAFEKGSLDHIHDEEPCKDSRDVSSVFIASESARKGSRKVVAVQIPQDDDLDINLPRNYVGPFRESPERAILMNGSSVSCESLSPPRVGVAEVSPPSNMSLGSLGSPPESPTFSALHSPVSPMRTSRNVLSSPDSRRTGFSSELVCSCSPTAIPILALSPTSQTKPAPLALPVELDLLQPLERLNPSMVGSISTLSPPPTSSVQVLSLPTVELLEKISPSLSTLDVLSGGPVPDALLVGDCNEISAPWPSRSCNFQNTTPLKVTASCISQVPEHVENLMGLKATSVAEYDGIHTSKVDCEPFTLTGDQSIELNCGPILPPSVVQSDFPMSSMPCDVSPAHSRLEARVGTLETGFPPLSSPPRESFGDCIPVLGFDGKQDQIPLQLPVRSDEVLSLSPYSGISHNLSPLPTLSLPSPPPLMTSLDFASVSSLQSLQGHSSFAMPSEISLENAEVADSRLVHGNPSPPLLQPWNILPQLTPTLKPSSDFLDSLPSPSRTSLELPTPPSRTSRDCPPPPPLHNLREISRSPLSKSKQGLVGDVQDALLEAITLHDKSVLKKVKTMQNPSLRKGDDRSHLLEQIRAQSFNLRRTVVEKVDPPVPRPMTNINVAAILEKANAIRQAFAGSDEDDDDDDDWSDV